jgi:hypothetical protein
MAGFTIDGIWHAERLPTGKWIVSRWIGGREPKKQVLIGDRGAFVRFETEAMANLMAGKENR